MDKSLSMIHGRNLEFNLWGAAADTATYLALLILAICLFVNVSVPNDSQTITTRQIILKKSKYIVSALLLTLFQILFVLKLGNQIKTSWFIVTSPLLVLELSVLIVNIIHAVIVYQQPIYVHDVEMGKESDPKSVPLCSKIFVFVSSFGWNCLRIAQEILILYQLSFEERDCMDWAVTFIPIWIMGGMILVKLIREAYCKTSALPWIIFLTLGSLVFIFFGLLVAKLNMETILSTSIIMVPIFILLALLFCCFCCCLPCLVTDLPDMDRQSPASDEVTRPTVFEHDATVITIDLRIEESI